MTTTRYFTLTTCAYLLLILPIIRLLGASFTDWLAVVFICLVSLVIFAFVEHKRGNESDELPQFTKRLMLEHRTWRLLEKEWIGRTVRLKEDIRNSKEPEGRQVYVQAGTLGKIVALNRDEKAPFTVLFPGFEHQVRIGLDRLDVPLEAARAGNVPVKQPAPLGGLLRRRSVSKVPARQLVTEDEDDIPEDAEAFIDALEDFAGLDWFLLNNGPVRLMYRQKNYRN